MTGIGQEGLVSKSSSLDEKPNVFDALSKIGVDCFLERYEYVWKTARRPVALVLESGLPKYILKWSGSENSSVENEAFMLKAIASARKSHTPFAYLNQDAIPNILHASDDLIIYEYSEGQTLDQIQNSSCRCDFNAIGTQLARFHAIKSTMCYSVDIKSRYLHFPIPIIKDITVEQYSRGIGADYHEYLRLLQSCAAPIMHLQELWSNHHLIHGDLRYENILISENNNTPKFIDWEMSGFGPRQYDVGTLIGERIFAYLTKHLYNTSDSKFYRDITHLMIGYKMASTDINDFDIFTDESIQYAGLALILKTLGRLEKTGSYGKIGHLMALSAEKLLKQPLLFRNNLGGLFV
jgi:thiamine kinase-like enzyme